MHPNPSGLAGAGGGSKCADPQEGGQEEVGVGDVDRKEQVGTNRGSMSEKVGLGGWGAE